MTKEEKIRAFSMRLDGMTLQEIGNELGVSKQTISNIFFAVNTGKSHAEKLANSCVFPALATFILDNRLNIKEFFTLLYKASPKEIYSSKCSTWYGQVITKRVNGQWPFSSAEWLRLAEVTGIPLEKLMDSNGAVRLERPRRKNRDE